MVGPRENTLGNSPAGTCSCQIIRRFWLLPERVLDDKGPLRRAKHALVDCAPFWPLNPATDGSGGNTSATCKYYLHPYAQAVTATERRALLYGCPLLSMAISTVSSRSATPLSARL